MTMWGAGFYGDPCRECGYAWSISPEDATALILDAPRRFAELLDGQDGSVRHRDLTWSVKAYVSHVADNIRGWAERIQSGTSAGQTLLRPWTRTPWQRSVVTSTCPFRPPCGRSNTQLPSGQTR